MKRLAAVAGLFALLLVGGAIAILGDWPRIAAGAAIGLWVLHKVVARIRRGPWYWNFFKRELFGKRETMQVLLRTTLGMAAFGLADLPVAGALVGTYVGARVLALNFLTPVYNRAYKSSILAAGLADVEEYRAAFRAFDTTSGAWMTQMRRLRSVVRNVEPVGWALVIVGAESEALAAWIAVVPAALAVGLGAATVGHFWIARSRRVFQTAERQLLDSLGTYSPEAVVYFSAPNGKSVYQVAQWLPLLESSGRRLVVVTRERNLVGALAARCESPVVYVQKLTDLERVAGPSARAVFYVNSGMKNMHMLRLAKFTHVQLLHGESDKGASANKSAASYDKLFVAGQLAIDRYRDAGIELADDRFVVVGRPMIDGLLGRRDEYVGRPCVLYAPTWEGFDAAASSCSVLPLGEAVVERLLALDPPVRVWFKPHPLTGSSRPEYGAARARIEQLVEAAAARDPGAGHRVVTSDVPINDAFDESDLLISDVSSVIVDYLATGKPMVVCDVEGLGESGMHERYPTSGGASIIGDAGQLGPVIDDALFGADQMQVCRIVTKARVLGPFEGDATEHLHRVLDALLDGTELPALPAAPTPDTIAAAPFFRCPICRSTRVRISKLVGATAERPISECRSCGFVGLAWNGRARTNRAANDRLGSADHPGRDVAMATFGLEVLGEAPAVRVLMWEPGISEDATRIAVLDRVVGVDQLTEDAPVTGDLAGAIPLLIGNEVMQGFDDPPAAFAAIAAAIGDDGLAVLSTDLRDESDMASLSFPFTASNRWYWSADALVRCADRHGLLYDARRPQIAVSKRWQRKRYVLLSKSPDVMARARVYFGDHFTAASETARPK